MAELGMTYDPATAERRTFDPIPRGWYLAQIIESDAAPTKAGNGERASFTFELLEAPYERRRLWGGINYKHANPEAQRIGQNELGELTAACGKGPIRNTEELHFIPILVKVGFRKDDPDQNEVKGYKPYVAGGQQQAPAQSQPQQSRQQQQPAQQPQQQRAAAGGSRPWR